MKKYFLVFFIVISVFALSLEKVYGQTAITQNPCDPRSTANNGTCPVGCNFAPAIEKGCNCFDNIDNDGDGKIDAADTKCASYFGLAFVGSGTSNCSITPPSGNPFVGIGNPVGSQQNTADTQSKVVVGDVDNDGIPDAVITSKWGGEVRVVATTNNQPDGTGIGKVKADFNLSGKKNLFPSLGSCSPNRLLFEHEILIADIDKAPNGRSEIFAIASNRGGNPKTPPSCFYLLAFRYKQPGNGGLELLYPPVPVGTDRPGIFGIADMDGDGKAEIYLRDRIYAAETGVLLASEGGKTSLNTALWDSDVTSAPVAVNVLGDNKMELVSGTKIYAIPSLAARNPAAPASLILLKDMNVDFPATKCFVKLMNDPTEYGVDTHSSTSVADIDGDGFIDVVISGALNSSVGRTAIFYWNVQKNTLSYKVTPNSTELGLAVADPNYANYATGWIWGTGRVNIGEANGDGKLDFTFFAGNQLFCLTTDGAGGLVTLWTQNTINTATGAIGYRTINDSRSGVLTPTIYDFNNDGNPEVVYRDSQSLNVIDGKTGQNLIWSVVCQSHTYTEGPVIADVNGDGATDICVTCNTSNSFDINDDIQQQALGQVRLYFSNTNSWLPTRKVWNQPGYFVVNINDNLTLPFPQLSQNLVFSNAPCPNGIPGPQRPLNIFLNQVPYVNANGCPVFPAPDLAFIGQDPATADPNAPGYFPAVVVTPPICGNLDIGVVFNLGNTGDLPISDNVPVSFFNGDPRIAGATRLFNSTININNLQIGDTLTTAPVVFNGPGTVFDLYIVLYNDGSVLPLTLSGGSAKECEIANNIYKVTVTPTPFTASINKVKDNNKCVAADPNIGELRARVFKGAVEDFDFSQYSFQWYTGTGTTNPIAAGQGGQSSVITGLIEGDYTLVVTNVQKGCKSAPVTTNIALNIVIPTVTITLLSDQTQCNPPNGSLQANVTGGNTGYTFEWFSNALQLGISTPVANGLKGDNYTVVVSRNGCTTTSNATVADLAIEPDAQASVLQNVVNCANLASGSITGSALLGGAIQNPSEYTFDWYFYNSVAGTRGSILPPANGTGPTRTGLAVGFYQLVVTRISTQCVAGQFPIVEVTDSTVLPEAIITETSPQTSCDPTKPNGVLTADVRIGGILQDPANFTFEWFRGDNTLPANLHTSVSGVNGRVALNVAGGGVFYTVKVRTTNSCSDTEKLIISENVNVPIITLIPTDNSICDPAIAGTSFNGAVSASVTFAGAAVTDFSNYSFTWHNGSQTTDPVIAVADNKIPTLTALNSGNYTVIAQRTDLFCNSLPVTAVVGNARVLPTITPGTTPSTNCLGGAANGQVTVTNISPAGPYTFKWYNGNSVNPGSELTPLNTATISGLAGGQNFTVEVTINSSGCRNTVTTPLADNKQLPILTLSPTPNSICDATIGFNGAVNQNTLSDTNAQGGDTYTYAWGNGSDMTSIIAGQTISSLTGRNGGFYSATITNNRLNCTSTPVTAEVINSQVLPAITTTTIPSTNCPGGIPNGATAANIGGVTAGYTFNWFAGNFITDPPVAAGNGGDTPTTNALQGGSNYTVKVRNNTSGCENTFTSLLPDNKALPVLTLTPTPNSICDATLGFNGAINQNTLSDTNAQGGDTYTYAWSAGNDMTSIIAGQTVSSLTSINGGFYTATIKNARLNCTSAPVTVEVINNQVFPVLTTSVKGSTNCDPLLKNGQAALVTVDGAAPSALYNYNWFIGNSVSGSSISSAATATSLQGGAASVATNNYTTEVTRISSGCKNIVTVNVPDLSILPFLSLTAQPNTICDPAKATASAGVFDGQVQAAISNIPAGGTINDYFFDWSAGTDGNGANLLSGLDVGTYSVTVLHNSTGCLSPLTSAQVTNAKILPTIDIQSIASQNCPGGAADGVAFVNSVLPGGKTYDYKWYDGNTASGTIKDTDATYENVQGGTSGATTLSYSVEVTILESGCTNTATVGVADDSILPQLGPLVGADNTFCVGSNGSASLSTLSYRSVAQAIPYTGFTFDWSNGDNGPTTTTPLAAGSYTLTVTNQDDNCISNPVSVTINDNLFYPVINVNQIAQTSCDLSTPNGVLTATVDETAIGGGAAVTAGNIFQWRTTNNFATGTDVTSTTAITGQINKLLGNQDYTVRVTNAVTGCEADKTVFEAEIITIPVASLAASTQTQCSPANGSITATVTPAPGSNYTYYWLKEQPSTISTDTAFVIGTVKGSTAAPNRLAVAGTSDTHNQLFYGDYTLVVYDQTTRCISQPVTKAVLDETQSTISFSVTNLPASCSANTGSFSMQANRVDLAATTFDFQINKGAPVNATTPINFFSNPPVFDPGLNSAPFPATLPTVASGVNADTNPTLAPGISSSIYTIVATDGFGCKSFDIFFLPFLDAHQLDETIIDSKLCPITAGDGSIEIKTIAPPSQPGSNQTQFTYAFYQGGIPTPAALLNSSKIASLPANNPYNYPVISAVNCVAFPGDAACTSTVKTTSTLAPGFYTIEVEENISGFNCKVYDVVEIKSLSLPPDISLASLIKANTACGIGNFNGEIDLNVAKNPSDQNPDPVTYDIQLNSGVFQTSVAPGTYPAANLSPNSYTFDVLASTGCAATRTFVVADQPVKAQLVNGDVAISAAEFCNPLLERSAKVIVSNIKLSSGSNEQISDYRFDWVNTATNSNVLSLVSDGVANNSAGGEEFLNNVPAGSGTVPAGTVVKGNYSVTVTKLTDLSGTNGIGCTSAPLNVVIEDTKIKPAITLTPIGNTSCDPSFFEGSIRVDVSTPSGVGVPGTYSYAWTPTTGPGQPVNSSGNSGINNLQTNIKEGSYTVIAKNSITECDNSLSTTLLRATPPQFSVKAVSNNLTNCGPFDGNINGLQVFINGAAGTVTDFDYVWSKADPNSAPVLDGTLAIVPVDDQLTLATYPAIALDKYFVKAIRKAGGVGIGCESPPLRKDILDDRVYPQVSFTTLSNTACDNNFDGAITVTSTTPGFGGGTLYNFDWTASPASAVITDAVGVISPALFQSEALGGAAGERIGTGNYSITVTNTVNNCSSNGSITVLQNMIPIDVVNATSTPLTHCALPDGTLTVSAVNVNGAGAAMGDFSFEWTGSGGPYPGANVASLTSGDYFVTATKTAITSPASGCESAPFKVTILDNRTFPVIGFSTLSSTSCDNNFDGQITVSATTNGFGPATNYFYDWTANPAGTTITDNTTASPAVFRSEVLGGPVGERIGPGAYSITVTNNTNMCPANGSVTLLQNTIPIDVVNAISTPLTHCTLPDGTLTVSAVNVNGAGAAMGDFSFAWTGNGGPYAGTNVASLTSGDYFVTATKTAITSPASGCESAPFKVTILDNRTFPVIGFSTLSSTTCDNNFDGQITVSAATNGFGPATNYFYDWTANPAGTTITDNTIASPAVFRSEVLGGPVGERIGPGSYSITVTNNTNMCPANGSVTLLQNIVPLDILTVTKLDQTICFADGSISVTTLNSGTPGDYSYQWFRESLTLPQLVDGSNALINSSSLSSPAYPTMGAGTYFVRATKNAGLAQGSGCITPPFRVDVLDLHKDPQTNFSFTPNSSCNVTNPNGVVLATASERDNSISTYTFNWMYNGGALAAATTQNDVTNTSQLTDSPEGDYKLTLFNTITGCSFISNLNVNIDLSISLPNIISVDKFEPTTCIGDGSAEVTSISIGGNAPLSGAAIAPPNFEYEWYAGNFAPGTILATTTPLLAPIANGKYYVLVKDLTTDCKSAPTEVELVDKNIVYPKVEITLTTPQISCDAINGTGVLVSTADGQTDTNANYTFNWFPSLDLSGAQFSSNSTISGLTDGNYSLLASNITTGCSTSAIYIIPNNSPQFGPQLSISGRERTLCIGQDGEVFGGIININPTYPFPYSYTANLYLGDKTNDPQLPTLTPDISNIPSEPGFAQNFFVKSLSEGFYTLRIIDNNTGCAIAGVAEVKDGRELPNIAIREDNPMINCDPLRANGQLSATADGDQIAGYSFDWFAGIAMPPSGLPIQSGDKLIGQVAGDYVVQVVRQLTGCVASKAGKITDGTVLPPTPIAVVERDRTNCILPNGWVSSNVGGQTINHTFTWYNGSAIKSTADFVGVNYFDRDIGPYTVTATDLITGCVSLPKIATVQDLRITPEVLLTTTPALCLTPTGTVSLTLLNNQEVVLTDIVWTNDNTGGQTGLGPEIYDLTAGDYSVNFTSSEGCTGNGSIEVITEILSYNLVSVNGDGKNDNWIIDCLENFPNNNVKVFNRSGILVYEADGYNNSDVIFRGIGEEGIYSLGNQLPDGTYFYIIDKRDGSKPITGYLELVR